jgi:hypothetical protein
MTNDNNGNVPPTDWSARALTTGKPVTDDHRELDPVTGQQKGYVVLTPVERARGFVRPVRDTYVHVGRLTGADQKQRSGGCGTETRMGLAIAETYAREPKFYSGTFCCFCRKHLPFDEFVWKGTDEQVGS